MIRLDVLAPGRLERDGEGRVISADATCTLIRTDDVLTHSHADHIQNLSLFLKAEIYIHEGEDIEIEGSIVVREEEMRLVPGVSLVHTPGHTEGSMSVFVESGRKYAVAGDAIPTEGNYRKMYPPAVNCDAEAALQSIKKIKRYADVIIPGHGFPFMARM
jgi:glyoxylase-like metal-dependent hydrolase (beta-lactamase superfamily II)